MTSTGELNLAALPAPQDQELLKKLVTFPGGRGTCRA